MWIRKDPIIQCWVCTVVIPPIFPPKDSTAIYSHCCFRCSVFARTYQQALWHLVCTLIYKCMFSLILIRKENQSEVVWIHMEWSTTHIYRFYLASFFSKSQFPSFLLFFSWEHFLIFHFNMNIHLKICFWGTQLKTCAAPFGSFYKLTWIIFERSWGNDE